MIFDHGAHTRRRENERQQWIAGGRRSVPPLRMLFRVHLLPHFNLTSLIRSLEILVADTLISEVPHKDAVMHARWVDVRIQVSTKAICITCWMLAMSFAPSVLYGQQRYRPARPTVSPYLNLLNNNGNVSGLPNYYSLVRPQIYQQEFEQQQYQYRVQQNQTIRKLQSDQLTLKKEGPRSGTQSWFLTPGLRSQYQNTSIYYSRSGVVPNRSAPRSSR